MSKVDDRWNMTFKELAVSMGDGQPDSPDNRSAQNILDCRVAETNERVSASNLRLIRWLTIWTAVMALSTTALVVVTIID